MNTHTLKDGTEVRFTDRDIEVPQPPQVINKFSLEFRKKQLLTSVEVGKKAEKELEKIEELLALLP